MSNRSTRSRRAGAALLRAAAAAFALAALAACSSPTPAPVLLSLPPAVVDAPAAAPQTAAASAPLLAIHRVALPEYIVARRVRYRADPSTLVEWPNTYWAERIEVGVSREFASALRQQLPGWSTCENNCGESQPLLAVQVDLVPMDFVRSAKLIQSRARISVMTGHGAARMLASAERDYDVPVGADTAQAQAEAITVLIRKVAADAAALVKTAQP
ncbi:MAG: membrane integrity-associated transporter subunit PqiC [Proteobacteria bacterium]|nr:membrane integrity-associated transporter subunit PqiC [Pseudomonadota bacterium]